MGYRRFDLFKIGSRAATIATPATVHVDPVRSVATVATVAGGIRDFESEPVREHASIPERDGHVSSDYADAFAAMRARRPPGMNEARHSQAIDDAGRFLDRWGDAAVGLGWPAPDLFDRAERGADGLLWELDGRAVVALTEGGAMLGENATTSRACFARPIRRATDAATA